MFRQNLINYVSEEFPNRTEKPYSISIERCEDSIWDTTDINAEYIVEINWEKKSLGYDKELLGLNNQRLEEEVDNIIDELDNRITDVKDGVDIGSPNIKYSIEKSTSDFSDCETHIESDLVAMRNVSYTEEVYTEDLEEISQLIINEIHSSMQDESVMVKDIKSLSLIFSDFKNCNLSTVKGYINTEYPHKYYKDVSTLEQYLESSNQYTLDDRDNDSYEIFFRLDYKEGEINGEYIPSEITQQLESTMNNRISNYVTVVGSFKTEAESILLDESDRESTTFWIKQDVEEVI
jgi:hypothetical protein